MFTVTNDLSYDQRMQRICRTLAENKYDVTLIGRKRKHSVPLQKKAFHQKRLRCFFNKGKLFYIEYNIRLFFVLLTQSADIYGAIDLDTLLPNYIIAKLKRKPIVYDAHEYFTEVPELVGRNRTKKAWLKLEQRILPQLRYAYTVSNSIATIYQEKYAIPMQVFRNMPYQSTLKAETKTQKRLIYQGALNKGRGIEALLEAMQDIDARLDIAGEGDLSKGLRKLCKKLGVEQKVHFLGSLLPEELRKRTQQAYIGINLLENASQSYYYSLSNKFFDYLQAEIPSINMRFPEYKSINENQPVGILINDLKKETIVQAVNQLLSDDKYYAFYVQNCQALKQQYCWEEESKKLLAFYNAVR